MSNGSDTLDEIYDMVTERNSDLQNGKLAFINGITQILPPGLRNEIKIN